jgi:ArsR family transcriptional regulator
MRISGYLDKQEKVAMASFEPNQQDLRRAANIFKVLSHPDRLRIVCQLFDGRPTTQRDLIDRLEWPQSTVSRHLSALRSAGLVKATRHGTAVRLEIGSPVAGQLMSAVCDWVHPETGEHFNAKFESFLAQGAQ